jgi:hypothetical protein
VSEQPPNEAAPEEVTTPAWSPPPTSSQPAAENSLAERPEVKIGVAFVGGFAFALLLKRLAR